MDDNRSTHSSMFGDLSTEEVTSKIILTAIIVLFMAVLFVLILHLYAKLYWWRIDQLQQQQQQQQQEQEQEEDQSSIAPPVVTRRQRRRFIFVPGQDALSNTGLTSFELSSLPIVFFRQDSCKDGLECSICLSELVKGDKARLLPKCNHSFHVECIDMWFQSHSTCPICRNTVLGPEQASSKRVEQVPDNAENAGTTNNNHDALSQLSTSSPEFPTNVLVWGRQDQVSTGNTNVGTQEDGAAGNGASQSQEAVVLDISDSSSRNHNVSSSSSSMRFIVEEEEAKSPMTTRLRSLRRFLSRDKRVGCSNSSTSNSSSSNAVASVDP
ncbi:RING-H2 zinc finger protein (ATL3); 86824-85850 [Arabidopsis thaliana]|uniref:RING-H2 finger protein ATL3 n=4 Tax=Arabidopsis TaxID=3701 RepID=ATL3_ARATH|nr:RING/U-box superfamily protein [Arabidopsis thaliana]Q9XF63.1 RecName: Full=RING-H2 finger protein ATL3; AltName: Full=RING-type E3 ubiquitin transferase ATL3 [Arabidopsis thaliana]KAG7659297.1 Zinc finger RING-type [Arabidopsis suecica]AAD33581.1 RING-H2 zinc finger protein ATL3 [Arabidopsis thaliana]AAG51805.1 RING-H2 zinc finger protein ATL3; 90350-91324 [Arabidopsis thaliana]AAG52584.1 RING-H2 zinc finger protein (ATL3); 86824-85850 [Arabidopsis thaliana]AAQ22609.1 At1g72310 [Arabidops|eukprot:NP_177375.1 RING/U-box superfamily protein [Arabidopsis thaliana]